MPNSTSLKQLAKELNLATSTVSRALRDSYEISTKTKKRVLLLAKKLNYEPNPNASSLRLQKSKTIAVVIPEITNHFFSLVINGIGSIANEKGYHMLIYLTHEDYEKEVSAMQHLQSGRVDGVLMSLSKETRHFRHITDTIKRGTPVVFFDRICVDVEAPTVTTDNYTGGFKATEHLIKNGCTKIAYLSCSPVLYTARKRMEGYLDALARYKIKYNPKMVIQCSDDKENYKLIYNLLKGEKRPNGIFASVERLAIESYQVCRDLKLHIPQKIKVICFANLETAQLLSPSMTTVSQPAYDIGKEASDILFKLIEKRYISNPNKRLVFPTTLMVRDSTSVGL